MEPYMADPPIYVIAGDHRQAEMYLRDEGVNPRDRRVRIVDRVEQLRGAPRDSKFWWVGSWRERRDAEEIQYWVQTIGGKPVFDQEKALRTMAMEPIPISEEVLRELMEYPPEGKVSKPVATAVVEHREVRLQRQMIARAIAETVLDPDERRALVDRLIEIFDTDPWFSPGDFRLKASG